MIQNGETLFLEKLTLQLDSQTQCFLFNVQPLWSKTAHFTMEIVKFWDSGVGLKSFGPKYQKEHPYAKSGQINHFGVCARRGVLMLYDVQKTKIRENAH